MENITEARAQRRKMLYVERQWQKKIYNLLLNDGQGQHHAWFAKRFLDYDFYIVKPGTAQDPDGDFTASADFDNGIIRCSQGFLVNKDLFYQLGVLIRHELLHNLLMHHIRMINQFNDLQLNHLEKSGSFLRLHNVICDFEVGDKGYSQKDRRTIKNMVLNGKAIGGLLTDDYRDWVNMSLEDMFLECRKELDELHAKIQQGMEIDTRSKQKPDKYEDAITHSLLDTYCYTDTDSGSMIKGDLDKFINNGYKMASSYGDVEIDKNYQDITKAIYDECQNNMPTPDELEDIIAMIGKAHPLDKTDVFGDGKVILYTPEEKMWGMTVLKKYRSKYTLWYKKVMKVLGSGKYTDDQIQEIFDEMK